MRNLLALSLAALIFLSACSRSEQSASAAPATPVKAGATAPAPPATPTTAASRFESDEGAIINQASYCAAAAMAQSQWERRSGRNDMASTLEQATLAYAKTTVGYGQRHGFSEAEIIAQNKKNDERVRNEIKSGFFFDKPSLDAKNENCLDLLKNTPELLAIWRNYFN